MGATKVDRGVMAENRCKHCEQIHVVCGACGKDWCHHCFIACPCFAAACFRYIDSMVLERKRIREDLE